MISYVLYSIIRRSMVEHERPGDHRRRIDRSLPLTPIPLPEELATFLREGPRYLCLPHLTSEGTAYIVKAPGRAIIARTRL